MQGNRIIKPANKQSGFSLVELMIAIAIGLVITAAVTAMAVNSLKMNSQTLKSARLNQDVGAVMQIMVNDIRRAGYNYCDKDAYDCDKRKCLATGPEASYVCYGTDSVPDDVSINDAGNCILYHYNRDNDGDATNENYGFRRIEVDGVGVMQMADNTGTVACDDADGNWVRVTDPEVIDVTSLEFNSDGSKCHNIDIDEGLSIRNKTGSSSIKFACNQDEPSKVQKWAVDGNGDWDWVALSAIPGSSLSSSGTSVGIRHVNISLAAELTRDSSVSKNLDVSIKVRNDHVYLN